MNNDNTLPEELQKEIAQFAADIISQQEFKDAPLRFIEGMLWGIDAGATEYAQKYQQAKTLLERIIMDHDLGLEMTVAFYRQIKSFLDGSK